MNSAEVIYTITITTMYFYTTLYSQCSYVGEF